MILASGARGRGFNSRLAPSHRQQVAVSSAHLLLKKAYVINISIRFEARLAQTVERLTLNQVVVGSIPTVGVHRQQVAGLVAHYFVIRLTRLTK